MKNVKKGWGYELWIHNDSLYCGKILNFLAGKRCSIHWHKLKHETFYVSKGYVTIKHCAISPNQLEEIENGTFSGFEFTITTLREGEKLEIPPYTLHQIIAHCPTELFEFSTEHFESDSYRLIKGD